MKRKQLYLILILPVFFFSACANDSLVEEAAKQSDQVPREISDTENRYTKDTESVYWDGRLIEEADPKTFEAIPGPDDGTPKDLTDDDFYFFKDKNAFYMSSGPFGDNINLYRYEMENIEDLVLPNSRMLHSFNYVNDGVYVYYLSGEGRAKRMTEADLSTFEQVDEVGDYVKDKNHIYFHGKILEGADLETFTRVSFAYKDNKNVYYYGQILEGADAETFQAVIYEGGGACYYKDKNYVYWKVQPNPKTPTLRIVSNADPETFECASGNNEYDGKDKNHLYNRGSIKEFVDSLKN